MTVKKDSKKPIKVGDHYSYLLNKNTRPSLIVYALPTAHRFITENGIVLEDTKLIWRGHATLATVGARAITLAALGAKIKKIYSVEDIEHIKEQINGPFKLAPKARFAVEVWNEKDDVVYRYNSSKLAHSYYGCCASNFTLWTRDNKSIDLGHGNICHFKRHWDLKFESLDC